MKNLSWLSCGIILVFFTSACGLNMGGPSTHKSDGDADFDAFTRVSQAEFLKSLNPLVFGTSTGADNKIAIGPLEGLTATPHGGARYTYDIPDGAVNLQATGGGGKIAGSEDGITFLFREVDVGRNFILSADFTVISFGNGAGGNSRYDKTGTAVPQGGPLDATLASNGQEGWGIMARDFVPQYPDKTMEAVKAKYPTLADLNSAPAGDYRAGSSGGDSNMIMVGGVRRGVRVYMRKGGTPTPENSYDDAGNPVTTLYMNSGVYDYTPRELPDYTLYTNEEGDSLLASRPDFPAWGSTYRLTLEKNNNEFKATIQPPADKGVPAETYAIPLYDILYSVNMQKYYVGFFAARDANVTITNIEYSEALEEDCAPYVPPLPVIYTPTIEILSPAAWGGTEYLYVKSNVAGTLTVSMNGQEIPATMINQEWMSDPGNNMSAIPFTLFSISTYIHREGNNTFNLIFYPDKDQPVLGENTAITGTDPINKSYGVTKKLYQGGTGDMYVAVNGLSGNSGSSASPLDLATALKYVIPGQTIIMKDGIYSPLSVNISRYNDGKFGQVKTLKAEHRDKAIIDFKKTAGAKGFVLSGNYWKIDGIHVRNTPDTVKGFTLRGNNNIVSRVKTYGNGDTGLQISGTNTEARRLWPSGNLIEYGESYDNKDAAAEDADGYAAKLAVGQDNEFRWCAAHHNVDDGWDLFSKRETGAIGVVKVYHCISYMNGSVLSALNSGDGNGFKMGGEGIPVLHEIHQSFSFMEKSSNITSNSNPALMVYDCTGYKTDGGSISIRSGDGTAASGMQINCVTSGIASNYVGSNINWKALLGPDPSRYYDVAAINAERETASWKAGFISRDTDGKFILKEGGLLTGAPVLKPNSNGAQELYRN
ncbi:MAG: hypothetical protein LBN21_11785 [Treponema sp.]|jgi:hypothetical protein|nr:hypothetical protein [Treponema sp.]